MHVQIITFQLNGPTEEQYIEACRSETEAFRDLPGLIAKVWLADAETNTYGGMYLWRDRGSMEAYKAGEIFASIVGDPNLENVTSRDFAAIEPLTKETQPGLALL